MYKPPWLISALADDDLDMDLDLKRLGFRIHGYCNVPPGYSISLVPRQASFIESDRGLPSAQITGLSYNYSLVKILVALGQAIYAIFTLYRARGDQIAQFGFAAFGLTGGPLRRYLCAKSLWIPFLPGIPSDLYG